MPNGFGSSKSNLSFNSISLTTMESFHPTLSSITTIVSTISRKYLSIASLISFFIIPNPVTKNLFLCVLLSSQILNNSNNLKYFFNLSVSFISDCKLSISIEIITFKFLDSIFLIILHSSLQSCSPNEPAKSP